MSQRTFVVGDIHGCNFALDLLLNKLKLTSDDTFVVLGDAVDRGPGTKEVVERLLDVQQTCKLVFIMGNHEEMLLDTLQGGPSESIWLNNGGTEALESYGGSYESIPESHIEFFKSGRDYWESDSAIFVHANLQPDVPLEEQTREWLRWARLSGNEPPHPSGKRVFCGHTPQMTGLPAVFDGWVCLDTWACNGLYLTCVDLSSDEIHQTTQSGEIRSGLTLDEI